MGWLRRAKQRLGPLWWHSIILMVAQRLGDVINAIIGLYLVPRFVPQSELGAILPLVQIGGLLSLPLSVLTTTFAKSINTYAVRGEQGKVKQLLRDVVGVTILLYLGVLWGARLVLPLVFERMRVPDGHLGFLVVTSGLLTAVGTLFTSALQALKKFRLSAFIGFSAAPVRLVALLVCLPISALSGFFVGQLVPALYWIGLSLYGLRSVFSRRIRRQSYWRSDGAAMVRYMIPVTAGLLFVTLQSTCESFVIRHRLPDADSAAYYLISRFAEIATYVGATLSFVLFPLASEQHERSDRSQRLVLQGMGASLVLGLLLAALLFGFGRPLLTVIPAGRAYIGYVPHMAGLAAILALRVTAGCFATHELACRRFGYLVPVGVFAVGEAVWLYALTGYSFFAPWFPSAWIDWMANLRAARLEFVLGTMFWTSVLVLVSMGVQLVRQRQRRTPAVEAIAEGQGADGLAPDRAGPRT